MPVSRSGSVSSRVIGTINSRRVSNGRDSELKIIAARVFARFLPTPQAVQELSRIRVLRTKAIAVVRRNFFDPSLCVTQREMKMLSEPIGVWSYSDSTDVDVRVPLTEMLG